MKNKETEKNSMESMTKNELDPIAIIGIGCRFPGNASEPQKFWEMLCEGTDAITDVPKNRWDSRRFYDSNVDALGKMYTKKGGFLTEKWEDFDAEFFHISPREAEYLDPQQRLLLELTWEAMEDAGIIPDKIRGSDTAVFIGGFTTDWQTLQNSPYNRRLCGRYTGMNAALTILSARLSYYFDLKGPCLTLDTACSSSLVAIHLACQNIRQRACSMAIVGGVNAMLIPETTLAMSKGRFLNPEGYCRSFDANANGYVRGEGGGVVILKRLSEALKDKDSIYSLILGTGVNHDGYTHGIALPNPEAQRTLIQNVLSESHIHPWQIHFAESHGTGTSVGDPIEAKALNDVLSVPEKRINPCFLGAVKTNLGHLEAAAGIAGLIKTALCLKHKKIPPNLHFKNHNPSIPFEKYCLKIPSCVEDFPPYDNSFFACVNSFGYGGTNSHVVLKSYEGLNRLSASFELTQPLKQSLKQPLLFPFSAKTNENLKCVANSIKQYLFEQPQLNIADVAYTLSSKRSHFDYRFSVSAQSSEELQQKLEKIGNGECPEGCAIGKCLETKPLLAFVYSGMGPQWLGMGRQLMKSSSIFFDALTKCDECVAQLAGWSLIEELQKDEETSRMEDPQVAQLSNYAIQVGLTELLKSWGVTPDAVVGHSIGEVAAAYASGSLSLEEGLFVTYHRSRIQSHRKNQGAMLAVSLRTDECNIFLADYQGRISIAAENGLNSVTLAGSKEDLERIAEILDKKNIFTRFLRVNIAYHSHQMDGLQEEVLTSLNKLKSKQASIPFFSTVFTTHSNERQLNAHYWWENIRQTVLFAKTIQNMVKNGYYSFIEIGPHPVLSSFIKEGILQEGIRGCSLATLNRSKSEISSLMECLGGLYVNGYSLNWDKVQNEIGHFIRLPTYPWEKKPYWIESEESEQYRLSSRHHPFLSRKIKSPNPTWEVEINSQHFPWLEDHKIDGAIVFPAAAYVEAGIAILGNGPCVLEEIEFKQVLTIQRQRESLLQVSLDKDSNLFKVHSLSGSEEQEWASHVTGKCCKYTLKPIPEKIDLIYYQQYHFIEEEQVYSNFSEQGFEYGPYFRGIKKLWKKENEALAEIQIPHSVDLYHIHPSLLDSALQTLIGAVSTSAYHGILVLPHHIEQLIFYSTPNDLIYCYAKCTKQSDQKIIGDLILCDQFGNVCVQIKGFECRLLPNNLTNQTVDHFLYHPAWEKKSLCCENSPEDVQHWLIGCFADNISSDFHESFKQKNVQTTHFSLAQLDALVATTELIGKFAEEENLHILIIYGDQSEESLEVSEIKAVNRCANLVKAISEKRSLKKTHLWIATIGTQLIEENQEQIHLHGSSLWGFGRVVRQEYSNIRCRLIDLDPLDTHFNPFCIEASNIVDDEIGWRGKQRFVNKLKKRDVVLTEQLVPLSANKDVFTLHLKTPGLIESLCYHQTERREPQRGEVGVQVHFSSLNFKDLMKVLGLLDNKTLDGTYFGNSFGMECSGTIVSVGPQVKNHKIGDKICCFIPNTFQSYINVKTEHIFDIPPNTKLNEASIYIPFMTVLRALKGIAKLKKGETILIHSATGAVGLAAIQYAQYVGAEIIATVGNEEKRKYLQQMGIQNCADSRSLSFVEDVKKWTHGRGVDVILNSLSDDALIKSWSLIAPSGRFIEIGKRDISSNHSLPMRHFNRNTLFASIDLDRFIDQPTLFHTLLRDTYKHFQKGIFKPLPCKIFPANQAVEAFQYMARSKHIGKIMLQFEGQIVQGLPLVIKKNIISRESSYLITGGFSGFGLIAAKWLVNKGVKHLILISRSGASNAEAQNALNEWREKGIHVKEVSIDITNLDQLADVLKDCEKEMPPLKGVIHSAMVLNDALISKLTHKAIEQVLMPKIRGCLNLHHCTKDYPLDFFVLFSSISSLIGNPGQANYAAANAFLDNFCHYRKKMGLPALTINWGALKMGVLKREARVAKHLDQNGIKRINPNKALEILEYAIQSGENHLCALDVQWQKMMQNMPGIKQSSVFSNFIEGKIQGSSYISFIEEVRLMDEELRLNFTIKSLKNIIGKALKLDPRGLDEGTRLNLMGVDSLMAMELHTTIEVNLGIVIPSMELMKGPSIKHLSHLLLNEMRKEDV